MAYEVHIERYSGNEECDDMIPITLSEWKAAVSKDSGTRLSSEPVSVMSDKGETIVIPKKDGDAQVLFPDSGEWFHIFRWGSGGHVSFTHPSENPNLDNPVWKAAFSLAKALQAKLIGDNGEEYRIHESK